MHSVADADVAGRTVFVRVDFNVPIVDGQITDDARIRAAVPTIQLLRERGAKVVLGSHLGRPKGGPDPKCSLIPCGGVLAELLQTEVVVPDDCVGDGVRKVVRDAPEGGVVLLENLRFYPAEEKADPVFAHELASLAQIYVNDAFGTAHRAHASTYTMVQFFPERQRFAGLLIDQELKHLGPLLHGAERPYVGIVGGAKVSDKLAILENLITRLDVLLVGGAMAYTFLAARGEPVGASLVEPDMFEAARALLRSAEVRKTIVVLPTDHVVAQRIDAEVGETTSGVAIGPGLAGFDVGPKTVAAFKRQIESARTVFWNGPLGVFERPAFSAGTFAIANALADCSATVVVGGGDSASALREAGRAGDVTHVSTGGGASLELLEGRELPGIAALRAGHKFA
ncbi:MAG: phosphoglycerate kinase [Myxococcales bacterium]|nr:phosphoglycerate kinase [Myxococcales bacterium]